LTGQATLTIKGRENHGLRGLAGKPMHPPLTDVPVTAYLFAVVFDVLSIALHGSHPAPGHQLFLAGTWTLLIDLVVRLTAYRDRAYEPVLIVILSVLAAGLVMLGASYGGTLVFDYGFNVETAGDHPVWHTSEVDVFPGHCHEVAVNDA
jgi:uncharacterized membrane protein